MKNLLFIFSLALFLASCGKEDISESRQQEDQFLSFSKSLTLEDENGNTADLTIYANTQTALDDHSENVLRLVVNKGEHNISSDVISEDNFQDSPDNDEKEDNFIYIKVDKYDFSDDVTGFKIHSDIEYLGQQSIFRYSESFYHYAFGSDDVNGARVEYTSETRSKEYLSIKFEKKTAPSNWFWQSLSTGKLYNVGDEWDYCGSTYWNKYKLKVKVHKAKAGVCCYGYDWEFLINC